MKKKMNLKDAVQHVHRALAEVYEFGYVLSGVLALVEPVNRMVDSDIEFQLNDRMAVMRIKTVPRDPDAAKDPRPMPFAPKSKLAAAIAGVVPVVASGGTAAVVTLRPAPAASPSGNVCSACGSANLRRSGTCETCQDCGSTTGCG